MSYHTALHMEDPSDEVTALVEALGAGEDLPLDELFATVYGKLHNVARGQRRRWKGQHTLSTTALVHEAYMKLSHHDAQWRDRSHFLRVASRTMRHILINYAERSRAQKRDGGVCMGADEPLLVDESKLDELLALDQALTRLAAENPRQARVVECRFFADLDVEETAEALGIAPITVMRDWRRGKAWLYLQLQAP